MGGNARCYAGGVRRPRPLPPPVCLLLLGGLWLVLVVSAARAGDNALKDALQDDLLAGDWIYEDMRAGYAKARETGKPLLVSFRCVP